MYTATENHICWRLTMKVLDSYITLLFAAAQAFGHVQMAGIEIRIPSAILVVFKFCKAWIYLYLRSDVCQCCYEVIVKGKERKVQEFNMQLKADLVSHTYQTNKIKRENQKKNWWAIKSRNGHNNPFDLSEKMRETTVWRIYGKSRFWVWSGTEMEWCLVKVMMMMMMNWWEKDEMTLFKSDCTI